MKKLFYIGLIALAANACTAESTTTIEDKSSEVKIAETDTLKKEEKKTASQLIVGTWQVDLSPIDNPTILTFNADGSATTTAKTGKKVKWEIKENEGKQILSLKTEEEKPEQVEIASIDDIKLTIRDKEKEIILYKK